MHNEPNTESNEVNTEQNGKFTPDSLATCSLVCNADRITIVSLRLQNGKREKATQKEKEEQDQQKGIVMATIKSKRAPK